MLSDLKCSSFSSFVQDIDDSLNTSLVEIVCRSDYGYIWETLIVVYTIGLSLGLLFMSYQNSKVSSHIAQEGEFAAKMTLLSLSFLLPTYIIVLLITQLYGSAQSANLTQPAILFWDNFVFVLLFASSVLGALFIPKVCSNVTTIRHCKFRLPYF